MNDNAPITVSLNSTRGWKRAERTTEDVAPRKLSSTTAVMDDMRDNSNDARNNSSSFPSKPSGFVVSEIDRKGLGAHSCDGNDDKKGSRCMVCMEHEGRYVCPRCTIPYCSIECYRKHTSHSSDSAQSGTSCTEAFFKEKVTSLMKLESLEHREKTHRALNRHHHEGSCTMLGHNSIDNDGENDVGENNAYDLYQLWSKLEALEDSGEELSRLEVSKLIPPSVKAMFENDLQNGQVHIDQMLKMWHPWWERKLMPIRTQDKHVLADQFPTDDETEVENQECSENMPTLDERLLKIPDVLPSTTTHQSSTQEKSKGNNEDVLFCNLLDVLLATCRTLRMYHGVHNASSQSPVEAATNLIGCSSVLRKDARFQSVSQVLNHHSCHIHGTDRKTNHAGHTETSDENENESKSSLEWQTYIQDIATLVPSTRLTGRAILEASDILKAAVRQLKKSTSKSQGERNRGRKNTFSPKPCENTTMEDVQNLRRLRKKLEFYLSWNVHHRSVLGSEAKDKILSWLEEQNELVSRYNTEMSERQTSGIDSVFRWNHKDSDTSIELGTLKFPSSETVNKRGEPLSPREDEPLLVAITSRRRQ